MPKWEGTEKEKSDKFADLVVQKYKEKYKKEHGTEVDIPKSENSQDNNLYNWLSYLYSSVAGEIYLEPFKENYEQQKKSIKSSKSFQWKHWEENGKGRSATAFRDEQLKDLNNDSAQNERAYNKQLNAIINPNDYLDKESAAENIAQYLSERQLDNSNQLDYLNNKHAYDFTIRAMLKDNSSKSTPFSRWQNKTFGSKKEQAAIKTKPEKTAEEQEEVNSIVTELTGNFTIANAEQAVEKFLENKKFRNDKEYNKKYNSTLESVIENMSDLKESSYESIKPKRAKAYQTMRDIAFDAWQQESDNKYGERSDFDILYPDVIVLAVNGVRCGCNYKSLYLSHDKSNPQFRGLSVPEEELFNLEMHDKIYSEIQPTVEGLKKQNLQNHIAFNNEKESDYKANPQNKAKAAFQIFQKIAFDDWQKEDGNQGKQLSDFQKEHSDEVSVNIDGNICIATPTTLKKNGNTISDPYAEANTARKTIRQQRIEEEIEATERLERITREGKDGFNAFQKVAFDAWHKQEENQSKSFSDFQTLYPDKVSVRINNMTVGFTPTSCVKDGEIFSYTEYNMRSSASKVCKLIAENPSFTVQFIDTNPTPNLVNTDKTKFEENQPTQENKSKTIDNKNIAEENVEVTQVVTNTVNKKADITDEEIEAAKEAHRVPFQNLMEQLKIKTNKTLDDSPTTEGIQTEEIIKEEEQDNTLPPTSIIDDNNIKDDSQTNLNPKIISEQTNDVLNDFLDKEKEENELVEVLHNGIGGIEVNEQSNVILDDPEEEIEVTNENEVSTTSNNNDISQDNLNTSNALEHTEEAFDDLYDNLLEELKDYQSTHSHENISNISNQLSNGKDINDIMIPDITSEIIEENNVIDLATKEDNSVTQNQNISNITIVKDILPTSTKSLLVENISDTATEFDSDSVDFEAIEGPIKRRASVKVDSENNDVVTELTDENSVNSTQNQKLNNVAQPLLKPAMQGWLNNKRNDDNISIYAAEEEQGVEDKENNTNKLPKQKLELRNLVKNVIKVNNVVNHVQDLVEVKSDHESVFKNSERGNTFKVNANISSDVNETIAAIIHQAAAKAGIDIEAAKGVIKNARDKGGVSNIYQEGDKYKKDDASNLEADQIKARKFSKEFQVICKECGIYSGRSGSTTGMRTAFIPEEALNLLDNEKENTRVKNNAESIIESAQNKAAQMSKIKDGGISK